MDDISPDQKRDAEPTLLHSDSLQFINRINVNLVEYRTDAPCFDGLSQLIRDVIIGRIDLVHLADLFSQCHLSEQCAYALLDGGCILQWTCDRGAHNCD